MTFSYPTTNMVVQRPASCRNSDLRNRLGTNITLLQDLFGSFTEKHHKPGSYDERCSVSLK